MPETPGAAGTSPRAPLAASPPEVNPALDPRDPRPQGRPTPRQGPQPAEPRGDAARNEPVATRASTPKPELHQCTGEPLRKPAEGEQDGGNRLCTWRSAQPPSTPPHQVFHPAITRPSLEPSLGRAEVTGPRPQTRRLALPPGPRLQGGPGSSHTPVPRVAAREQGSRTHHARTPTPDEATTKGTARTRTEIGSQTRSPSKILIPQPTPPTRDVIPIPSSMP
ncbi:PREDICTED: proline-rich protein 2-like [Cyprinodon variegatus]|uniref:proline-rich protein 2-like n=1 Tax=Cyprinodon variegatus TaxID=28743 RepID=UPI00074252A8|nr:PREDICTED: proline-rich protein 2-like [Cyprinodon variegatus]